MNQRSKNVLSLSQEILQKKKGGEMKFLDGKEKELTRDDFNFMTTLRFSC